MDSETHVNHSENSLPVTGATSSAYTDPESTAASFDVKSGSEAETIDASSPWNLGPYGIQEDQLTDEGIRLPEQTVEVSLIMKRGQRCCHRLDMTGRGIVKFIVLNGLYIDFETVRDDWAEAALPSANTWQQLENALWTHNTETMMREGEIRALMEAGQSVPNGDHEWEEFTRLPNIKTCYMRLRDGTGNGRGIIDGLGSRTTVVQLRSGPTWGIIDYQRSAICIYRARLNHGRCRTSVDCHDTVWGCSPDALDISYCRRSTQRQERSASAYVPSMKIVPVRHQTAYLHFALPPPL
jgi:hypothetical protein